MLDPIAFPLRAPFDFWLGVRWRTHVVMIGLLSPTEGGFTNQGYFPTKAHCPAGCHGKDYLLASFMPAFESLAQPWFCPLTRGQ